MLTLIVLSGCGGPAPGLTINSETMNRDDYPSWFFHTPTNGDYYVVGTCQPCLDNDSSVAIAATDAYWQILGMHEVRIKMKSGVTGLDTTYMHLGYDVKLEVDTARFENISKKYKVLKKFYSDQKLLVLVGPENAPKPKSDYSVDKYGEWWHEIPDDESYFYAVGSAPKYYYESSSWSRARGNALLGMTGQVESAVNATSSYDGRTIRKTYIEEGDALLYDWQIVARHFVPSKNSYHVLIRMPKRSK